MARWLRLWEKKRGDRRTGSRLLGSVGEALFFAALFLLGSIALTAVITVWATSPGDGLAVSLWGFWLLILVLVSLVLIGGGGVIFTALEAGASAERRAALVKRAADIDLLGETLPSPKDFPNIPSDENLKNSPGITLAYRLPIEQSSAWRLMAAAVFCLASNAIASVLLVVAVNGHLGGRADWFLTLFLIPLLAVGGWAFYYFVRQMILHTGVGPTSIEISDHPLHPGGRYQVLLTQSGRLSIRWLELALLCQEEATYRQGTDIRKDTQTVHRQRVWLRQKIEIKPGKPFQQLAELAVPDDAMHSFQSASNAIHWKLIVKGEAEGWPTYQRSFPVVVYPDGNGVANL